MRVLAVVGVLLLGACAGQPPVTQPADSGAAGGGVAAPATPSAPPPMAKASGVPIDPEIQKEARRLGFTPLVRDGEILYCRDDFKTGSHVQRETVCMTPRQIEAMREQTQQQVGDAIRRSVLTRPTH